jgi:hypothetical protein
MYFMWTDAYLNWSSMQVSYDYTLVKEELHQNILVFPLCTVILAVHKYCTYINSLRNETLGLVSIPAYMPCSIGLQFQYLKFSNGDGFATQ